MAYDNSRGKLYDPDSDIIFDMGKVTSEDVSLSAGLFRKAVPTRKADNAVVESVWGRVRFIRVEGEFHGTQLEMETFIAQFTSRVDINGFQKALHYYPLLHPSHAGGVEGYQTSYYSVLINDFSYRLEREKGGFILLYDLELFEGTRVKDYLS